MKKLMILFSFVLLGLNLSAQTDSSKYYFYKAYNSSDYKFQIVNYTKCLRLNPDDAQAYYNRGIVYNNLGKFQLSIDDYSSAIRINPAFLEAYNNRGNAKEKLGQYYCDDYKKACELGAKRACSSFSSQCK